MMKSAPLPRHARLTSFLRGVLKPHCALSATAICEGGRRSFARRGQKLLGAAAVAGGLFMSVGDLHAQVYTWNDTSNLWNNAGSWNGAPTPPPDVAGESAIFGTALAFTAPSITANTVVNDIQFNGPTAFIITNTAAIFTILGDGVAGGILNNSGVLQTINNAGAGSVMSFGQFATAGTNMVINNSGTNAQLQFLGNSNAGSATLNNVDPTAGGQILFGDFSSAASATINNVTDGIQTNFAQNASAGSASINNIGAGSATIFDNSSTMGAATVSNIGANTVIFLSADATGGTATVINGSTGLFDISTINAAGTTVGSIEGGGTVDLGPKNLIVGLNGKSTIFSGVIQGIGGSLTVAGGTLRLTGINTYTGDTRINSGGSLFVNGSIASMNTYVNHGGLLGGTGTIFGNVFNHGTVKPGNSPGTLTVQGSYTQYDDGDLRIEIESKSNYGRLRVGGTANLDGSVTAVRTGGYKLKAGDEFEILTAGGGVNGEFDKLNHNFGTNTILKLGLRHESHAVYLEVQQGSFLEFAEDQGLTYNQTSVAGALDTVIRDNGEHKLIEYLNYRSLNDLPEDFDRIAPEELATAIEISVSLAGIQNNNILRHTELTRSGSTGFNAAGLAMQGQGPGYNGPVQFRTGAAGPTGYEGKESKEVFVPEDEKRWGAFLTGVGEWVDVDGDGNARGFDINTGGFTLGLDYRVTPNFVVGVTAGYAGTSADLNNDGRIWVNGGKLGVYGTYFTGGFYVDAAATAGYNSYDTKRSGLEGSARGDTEGAEFSGLLATGYDFKSGGWSFGPTANVQYTYVEIDSFRENGSLAPLRIQEQEQESLRTAVGFRASYDLKVRDGGIIIRPELRTAWQHEFADDTYEVNARFQSGAGGVFSVNNPEIGRDSLLLGAGVVVLFSERVATYLYYDAQLARANYESHTLSGGVRVTF